MSVRAALAQAAQQLEPISDTPRLDAELLMAHALGVERSVVLLDPDHHSVPRSFARLLARRITHEPVAYILGYRDFWTIRLAVGPGALIPRPDSETLIEAAVAHFGPTGPRTILDLGTGPGTLLLAALDQWPNACGVGIDNSDQALAYARTNARALGLADRANFAAGGWADGGAAELILCNPPYIAADDPLMRDVRDYEPHTALFAGNDGLDAYRQIIPTLAGRLSGGGIAIIEIGATQRAAVTALATDGGLAVTCRQDLGGRDRALICRLI